MGLLKYTLVAALAAGIVTGLAAARVKPSHPVDARVVVVQPGVLIQVRGIDLSCRIYRHDPNRAEVGPLMYCQRTSAPRISRGIGVSMWHYFVSDSTGKFRIYRVGRSP